ncbi:MAG: ribonuclease P protein component [Prevotella sp.]|nr:ribonuclease P protein component [Paraprevotella sp.]MDD5854799.1 ribonuclease P protein component [Prevotella sp.]MDD7691256.1 ribonuclease P protein component [Prevotella sp.]MDY4408574.1 ribonuclease P protein component [Prevotella sp.]
MSISGNLTFGKQEKLCAKRAIDRLFVGGNSRSVVAFPIRLVYMPVEREQDESLLKVLVTVSKKHFKHAVDRNRTKRLLREAWRLHRNEILQLLRLKQTGGLDVALIWLDDKLWTAKDVDNRMSLLLKRLSDKLSEQLTHANKANVSTDVSDKDVML